MGKMAEIETAAVVGLGKLGLPLALVLADAGFRVRGVDVSFDRVEAIKRGELPRPEPRVEEMLRRLRADMEFGTEVPDAVREADVVSVVVPTPSDPETGRFSTKYARKAMRDIGRGMRGRSDYPVVSLVSTVLPQACGEEVVPELEEAAGGSVGEDLGFCYNPAFIALGSVVGDLVEPDFVLIGESGERAGSIVESVWRRAMREESPIRRMAISNAEITKIALNTFLTTKISFANMLAELAETVPGGDVDVVTRTLGLDRRVGRSYLKGALGYGGPCFPRDNRALGAVLEERKISKAIPDAADEINERQPRRVAQLATEAADGARVVSVLGASYKPNTDVTEESQGVKIAERLSSTGIFDEVILTDPEACERARKDLEDCSVVVVDDAEEAVRRAGVLVIATPWDQYREFDEAWLRGGDGTKTVVDCWRLFDEHRRSLVRYLPIGTSVARG